MTIEKKISKLFGLDGDDWLQHANLWSVWTRFAILPFLVLVIWSRVWIGWFSLAPIAALIVWTFINLKSFGKPNSTDIWSAKCVSGKKSGQSGMRLKYLPITSL